MRQINDCPIGVGWIGSFQPAFNRKNSIARAGNGSEISMFFAGGAKLCSTRST